MTKLLAFVVVYNAAMKSFHYCSSTEYQRAAKDPNYDWELKDSFDSIDECCEYIDSNQPEEENSLESLTVVQLKEKATEMNLPEAEWKSLKKADLIAYIEANS